MMDKFKRSLSFRKKRDSTPESSKPHQWQEDEKKVREGTCSFQVRYLGCVEVFESRGIQVCEEAIKGLKSSKGKYQRAILYVSGDALRVVDEISKGLIVDQTIEKVSFCAPDRNNDKGFAYICRDGTTRRWMCHGFLALKESGERLSHAVGCAFTVCLEKKQAREKEKVTVTFNEDGTSFTRTGSFRQTTLTERLADPQSAIIAEPVPVKKTENLFEIQRPRASVDMMQRQNSFRGFSKLAETSPFKRQMSLRLDELSATTDRLKQFANEDGLATVNAAHSAHAAISPIMEASPMTEPTDSISQMCQQVTHGLSALTSDDPFLVVPSVAQLGIGGSAGGGTRGVVGATGRTLGRSESQTNTPRHSVLVTASSSASGGSASTAAAAPYSEPIRQSNPWSSPAKHHSKVSDADFWLRSTATIVGGTRNPTTAPHPQPYVANGVMPLSSPYSGLAVQSQRSFAGGDQHFSITQRAPHLMHIRAHSVDSAYSNQHPGNHQSGYHAAAVAQRQGTVAPHGQNHFTGMWNTPAQGVAAGACQPTYDPFDAAWAAKVAGRDTNPFHSIDSSSKSFEVKL